MYYTTVYYTIYSTIRRLVQVITKGSVTTEFSFAPIFLGHSDC